MYDGQRHTLSQDLSTVLQSAEFQGEWVLQQIAADFVRSEPALRQAVQLQQAASTVRLADADELRDAAVSACGTALQTEIWSAVADQDEARESLFTEIQSLLFPRGPSVVVYASYQAESGMIRDIMARCRENTLQSQLQQAGLWGHFERLERLQQQFEQVDTEVTGQKSQSQNESQNIQKARKNFDKALSRLLRYVGVRYDLQVPAEATLVEKIMKPVEQARLAAAEERKLRKKSKPTPATKPDPTVTIAWDKKNK